MPARSGNSRPISDGPATTPGIATVHSSAIIGTSTRAAPSTLGSLSGILPGSVDSLLPQSRALPVFIANETQDDRTLSALAASDGKSSSPHFSSGLRMRGPVENIRAISPGWDTGAGDEGRTTAVRINSPTPPAVAPSLMSTNVEEAASTQTEQSRRRSNMVLSARKPCDWCGQAVTNMSRHKRTCTRKPAGFVADKFQCTVCPSKHSRKDNLRYHINRFHPSDRCPIIFLNTGCADTLLAWVPKGGGGKGSRCHVTIRFPKGTFISASEHRAQVLAVQMGCLCVSTCPL
jgi:hypothetical protein